MLLSGLSVVGMLAVEALRVVTVSRGLSQTECVGRLRT